MFRARAAPISPVDERGILQIAWPTPSSGGVLDLDFLLATATRAECTRPTAEVIADAWVDQQGSHERYFFENVRNGIRTRDDIAIWKRIRERGAPWLQKLDYADAIAVLTSEEQRGA
jgi:hypothetical protein